MLVDSCYFSCPHLRRKRPPALIESRRPPSRSLSRVRKKSEATVDDARIESRRSLSRIVIARRPRQTNQSCDADPPKSFFRNLLDEPSRPIRGGNDFQLVMLPQGRGTIDRQAMRPHRSASRTVLSPRAQTLP